MDRLDEWLAQLDKGFGVGRIPGPTTGETPPIVAQSFRRMVDGWGDLRDDNGSEEKGKHGITDAFQKYQYKFTFKDYSNSWIWDFGKGTGKTEEQAAQVVDALTLGKVFPNFNQAEHVAQLPSDCFGWISGDVQDGSYLMQDANETWHAMDFWPEGVTAGGDFKIEAAHNVDLDAMRVTLLDGRRLAMLY
jgi:hypothetical protein